MISHLSFEVYGKEFDKMQETKKDYKSFQTTKLYLKTNKKKIKWRGLNIFGVIWRPFSGTDS